MPEVLRNREYVGLIGASLLSAVGDHVSRVALSVLVYSRTGSPLLTALVYAVTYLPAVLGGPLLSGLADRLPRRRVLVGVDLVRATLIATMAIPGAPLGLLLVLLLCSSALEAPFAAARASLMRNVLDDDDLYRTGVGIDQTLHQSAQVVGFAGGGLLLTVVPPTTALLLDAVTFLVSAAVLMLFVKPRPAALCVASAACRGGWMRTAVRDAGTGLRAATATAARRRPVLLTWVGVGVLIVPEAIAAPWSHALGAGSAGTGLLLAAGPVGAVVGLLLVTKCVRGRGDAWLAPLALLSMVPLIGCAFSSSLTVVLTLVALSGAAGAYVTLAQIAFVSAVDDASRGRAFGVAASGVTVAQGLGIAAGGASAEVLPPAVTVGLAGTIGLLAVALVALRTRTPQPVDLVVELPDAVLCLDPLPAQREPDVCIDLTVAATSTSDGR